MSKFLSHQLLSEITYCVIDLETTGGNLDGDEIIEIGIIKVKNLKVVQQFHSLISPSIKVPQYVLKLTSIDPIDLENAPLFQDIINDIESFIKESVLVAHNSAFDIPFLNSMFKRNNKNSLENKSICTNIMAKNLIPELTTTGLSSLAELIKLPAFSAHRALEDAKTTTNLLLFFLKHFKKRNLSKINHLYYSKNKFEMDRINIRSDEEWKEFLNRGTNLFFPASIEVKNSNGRTNFIFISNNLSESLQDIGKFRQENQEGLLLIRIFGHKITAFFHLKKQLKMLNEEAQSRSIALLPNLKEKNISDQTSFIIVKHLIPDHFIIYSLDHEQYSGLIFKFPAHQKKLKLFINQTERRIKKRSPPATTDKYNEKELIVQNHIFNIIDNDEENLFFEYQENLTFNKEQLLFFKKNKIPSHKNHYPFVTL